MYSQNEATQGTVKPNERAGNEDVWKSRSIIKQMGQAADTDGYMFNKGEKQ